MLWSSADQLQRCVHGAVIHRSSRRRPSSSSRPRRRGPPSTPRPSACLVSDHHIGDVFGVVEDPFLELHQPRLATRGPSPPIRVDRCATHWPWRRRSPPNGSVLRRRRCRRPVADLIVVSCGLTQIGHETVPQPGPHLRVFDYLTRGRPNRHDARENSARIRSPATSMSAASMRSSSARGSRRPERPGPCSLNSIACPAGAVPPRRSARTPGGVVVDLRIADRRQRLQRHGPSRLIL